jgi:hypothetical protein
MHAVNSDADFLMDMRRRYALTVPRCRQNPAHSVASVDTDDDCSGPSRGCGFRNHDLRQHVADLLGVSVAEYTSNQMTYDLRRLRLKGLIYRPPRTNRYFVTPYGWKVARLFSRQDARVFRPAMAMFTGNDAVLPFPLRSALDRADAQLDVLIYQAFPLPKENPSCHAA